jgi:hypothetical protein
MGMSPLVGLTVWDSYQSFILVVCPDPHPDIVLIVEHSQSSMAGTYSDRPDLPNLLEI